MIDPEQCSTMAEVRQGVDQVDDEIVKLIATRFRFMDAAARIKSDRDQVRDERRKAEVIDRVRRAARDTNIPDDLMPQLYDTLVERSIAYEFDQFDARSDA
jgi:isochorismate pyruvate lyase